MAAGSIEKWVYDIEVYPNYFCVTFMSTIDRDNIWQFEVFDDVEDKDTVTNIPTLIDFISEKEICLIGFNNSNYDDILLKWILLNARHYRDREIIHLLTMLHTVSSKIVTASNNKKLKEEPIYRAVSKHKPFLSIDLMKVGGFDKQFKGLKQIGVSLKSKVIEDLPYSFDTVVNTKQKNKILEYNINDVIITKELYHRLTPELMLRQEMGKFYNISILNKDRTGMAKAILDKEYAIASGEDISEFRDKRTYYDFDTRYSVADCISSKVKFQTHHMQSFLSSLKHQSASDLDIDKKVLINETWYQIASGGLHSIDEGGVFESNNNFTLIDADVTSFYPNVIINENICPKHLNPEAFFSVLEKLKNERVSAKSLGNKIKSEGLKEAIVAVYGNMGMEYYWLYDPKALLSVCITGQLLLLMLVERLEESGFQVISANTDGVLVNVANDYKFLFYEICNKWMIETELILEYNVYKQYIRNNVNSYIAVNDKDEVKEKNDFITSINLSKGFDKPIIAIALRKHFLEGIDIEETITNHKDILDFCMAQKSDKKFEIMYNFPKDGIWISTAMQKTNRYYVSNGGGSLTKKDGNRYISLCANERVTVINDMNKAFRMNMKDYDIKYSYYIKLANEIINKIVPKQEKLLLK